MRSMSETRRIFQYFCTAWRGLRGAMPPSANSRLSTPTAGPGDTSSAPSAGCMVGLMIGVGLLKHAGDYQVQGRVLHADVNYRIPFQDGGQHLGNARAVDFQTGHRTVVACDFPEARQV